MKILFATSEAVPYFKTGGLADVARALPDALAARGHDVRVVMPRYRAVDPRARGPVAATPARVPWPFSTGKVRFLENSPGAGAADVLIDAPDFFDVADPYADGLDPLAAGRRFAFFCRAVLEIARAWDADVVHLNDWPCGFLPVYALVDGYRPPTVFAIHNLAYQGNFPPVLLAGIGVPMELFRVENGLEFHGSASFMKAGLALSDRLVTVSPNYAREIQTAEYGAGFDGLLRFRRRVLNGILNGIDPNFWNPETDAALAAPYGPRSIQAKARNRTALLRETGIDPRGTVLAMVTRLAHQKGVDILLDALPDLLKRRFRLIVLGDGDPGYESTLAAASAASPRRIAAFFRFDDGLARRIYAGADFFLMPSIYEPCGLGQMIAQRYGTPPIVRRTGGLADTVEDGVTGFAFDEPDAGALLDAAERARAARRGPEWDAMRRRCMEIDRSWDASAARYERVYRLAEGAVVP